MRIGPITKCPEPESYVEHTLVDEQVRSAVSRLPQRQREVLLLLIRDDLTYKQIAARLNLTHRVVRRDIATAYAQLRAELRAESHATAARDPVELELGSPAERALQ